MSSVYLNSFFQAVQTCTALHNRKRSTVAVYGSRNGRTLVEMDVYAPDENAAFSIMQDWISRTEHLCNVNLKLAISRRSEQTV